MIVSLLYKLTRRLLFVPSALLRGEAAKDAELLVLRHENAVLRRKLCVLGLAPTADVQQHERPVEHILSIRPQWSGRRLAAITGVAGWSGCAG